ncbi:bifunctional 4-hydroxy-3-methylbut-2-enyl diphosphate reductase/30S ribosomal protein S1 [Carboxydothermus ferrireducens]|uniref:4-hydroxy-3-methylbut-2-enyl diphosphate reductase n=1 Tax=Carboxydothermus ferrireducens DSM 11255 TaxID=1119529 RepID=A0ABX2RBR5_9THEO|nr:bifunctional 4-hydroxy-3-methylbut-2-enyl diphosphate reductase/30S ribosomal protein S1 [Carboxydothermus ferrireducens]NYE58639.1 4-hydroxy-3-methylbut-2-enyl diphosphate reductase [Carboxydothermus ferrireducens DSM 11255]
MEIIVAQNAGFCFGVKRAIETAQKAAENNNPVYSLGPLIHNPQEVERLKKAGIIPIEEIEEGNGKTIIIRSHGTTPEKLQEIVDRGYVVEDATCPFVKKAQILAQKLTDEGYQVVVVGDKKHPEVQGIVGWSGYKALVVENPEEAARLPFYPKIAVIAQTTQKSENFWQVVEVIKKKGGEVRPFNTICHATRTRQEESRKLATEVEVMLVVGGKNSANTKKLAQICAATNTPTYLIEEASEIKPEWFAGKAKVGITAGASTPAWIIEEVRKKVEQMASMEQALLEIKPVKEGEIVRGKVVKVLEKEVLVDIGTKGEGVIPLEEITWYRIERARDAVKEGDEFPVLVLKEDEEGKIILSRKKALEILAEEKLLEWQKNKVPVTGKIVEVVKGGVLVDIGVRAFLPASLIALNYVEDLEVLKGEEITAYVIEVDLAKRRVVLDRKSYLKEQEIKTKKEKIATLKEGSKVKGKVTKIMPFGAFVDLGGFEGLLRAQDISWQRNVRPEEHLQVGQELEVVVLEVDRHNLKVNLGLKQLTPDPWQKIPDELKEGAVLEGTVVKILRHGLILELFPGIEGYLPARETEAENEPLMKKYQVGQKMEVKILTLKPLEKKMTLSQKEALREKEKEQYQKELAEEENLTFSLGEILRGKLKDV